MRHGSLFSGVGGFDLAAEWMGWENIFHCENNEFCGKILKQHFPDAIQYKDIKSTNFTIWRDSIDIITGGFPCQPYSTAGKRKGDKDDRHLWPEMLRAIRECKPKWIVGENVRGLISWNEGLVFGQVCTDLEAEGYEVIPFLLPACAVNAPHRRERIWFIAHTGYSEPQERVEFKKGQQHDEWWRSRRESASFIGLQSIANSGLFGQEKHEKQAAGIEQCGKISNWNDFPTVAPVCGRNDGIPNRVDRIKSLGNAVVPQVVYQIFKAIEAMELQTPCSS